MVESLSTELNPRKDELLASLSALQEVEKFVPGQFRTACVDATLAKFLQRL